MTDAALLIGQARLRGATEHQVEEILAFLIRHQRDEAEARAFGARSRPITGIHRWPHDALPGILAAHCGNEIVETFLPAPRPMPRDPFFQHAEPLRRDEWLWFSSINAARGWHNDWQWHASLSMDAPIEMPAGACEGFELTSDIYGARQMTTIRDEAWT